MRKVLVLFVAIVRGGIKNMYNTCRKCNSKEALILTGLCDDCFEEYEEEVNSEYTEEITCPWCGYGFSDSWEYEDNSEDLGLIECEECSKRFYANRNVEISYSTGKANYGSCNHCSKEDVVLISLNSSIGKYKDLCEKCGDREENRLRKEYFEKNKE